MCGCSRKQDFSCVEQLEKRVPIGTPVDIAEKVVKECGLEYSLDKPGRVLHAVKRGRKKGVTEESRAVVIRFDESGRVSSVEVKPAFTGP